MLRRFMQSAIRLLSAVTERPLAMESPEERLLAAALRERVRSLPSAEPVGLLPSAAAWAQSVRRLRELVLTCDPREFLRWDVVQRTMFIRYSQFIGTELAWLRERPDWMTRWQGAIREDTVGRPVPFSFYRQSSANLIHHGYHVAQFEKQTGISIDSLRYVVEFGGGYGSMCRLFHKLGFSGKYIIFDLPEFSALQEFYLRSLGLDVLEQKNHKYALRGVACVSDREEFGQILDQSHAKDSMLVATWSISETPVALRDAVLPFVAGSGTFLIAFQHEFGEVDNQEYFAHWKKLLGRVAWLEWEIPHLKGNSYLVGSVKANSL